MCDLCGEETGVKVLFCPTKALQYLPAYQFTLARRSGSLRNSGRSLRRWSGDVRLEWGQFSE